MSKKILFHGTEEEFSDFKPNSFFSTSESFSKDYGKVSSYEIELTNTFDSSKYSHIKKLLKTTDLYDEYNEIEVTDLDGYDEATNYCSDTWEIIEPYISDIKRLGKEGKKFDSIRIFEGGIENFIIFDNNQIIKKIEKDISRNNLNLTF